MFTKLKKKIEEENQTELNIGIPPPPPQLPTPTHRRRASDCGVSTPGRSTCSEASDSDREQKPKKLPPNTSLTENELGKQKGGTPKRAAPTSADYEEVCHKLRLIKREKQELEQQLRESEQRVELLAGRCENREEIESFQSQEMAKVKHLLLCSQQELRAADERLRQRSQELQQAQDRVSQLERALSEGGEQARARALEQDKAALEAEVDRLKQDTLQSANRISQLECELGSLTDEHDGLKHTHDVYKSKATTVMDEKDRCISDLEDKIRTLEKRLEGTTLTGDEHIQSLVEERKAIEKKLDESRQHLSEVKTSWSDKINNLEAQIFNLNQKMAEDSQECSRMEKLLADAQQRLRDQQQVSSQLEAQLATADAQLSSMRRSHAEELERQRSLQDAQLDELRLQAADLRAQLSQAQRERDREASRAQARIAELQKKEVECKKSQELIQGLETSQQISSEKVAKLEKQLSFVSHSETTLKHSVRRSEAELKAIKEEVTNLKQKLSSLVAENKKLKEGLEALWEQADKERGQLQEEVAHLQESLRAASRKVEQLEEEAAINETNSTSLADLQSKVADLEDQVSEKNKMLKLQQQRISDMKKTLQRELKGHHGASSTGAALGIEKMASLVNEVPPSADLGSAPGPAGNSVLKTGAQDTTTTQPRGLDNKLEDDINFKYLKHVVFKFMTSKEYEAQHLIRAVSVLLRFTADEEQLIREHLDWKNSWFGTRPQLHHAPHHPLPHHGHGAAHHRSALTSHPKGNAKTT
ncbi:golgin subfamily A member 1-like isoform X2 [Amblyomma americanum]